MINTSTPSQPESSPRRSSRLLSKSQENLEPQVLDPVEVEPSTRTRNKKRLFIDTDADSDDKNVSEKAEKGTRKNESKPKPAKKNTKVEAKKNEPKKTETKKESKKPEPKKSEPKRPDPKPEPINVPATPEAEKKPIHPFFLPRSQQPKPQPPSSPIVVEDPFKLGEGKEKPIFFLPSKEKIEKLNEMSQKKLKEDVCKEYTGLTMQDRKTKRRDEKIRPNFSGGSR